ncbi:junctional adhesion molecule 2a isoform X4 [Cyclopterus lumpus]|uniref:junctional adhesion molecule 2a isoform X4 n=1 Tax=Cyclopterus lumpus TaxID=8103 RepID=UPI0014871FDF|nr:junctional adhesion molecule 2a isoform X4 [Cyclopterus lumpus]
MNYWRVVNKCEKKAEARDLPPRSVQGRLDSARVVDHNGGDVPVSSYCCVTDAIGTTLLRGCRGHWSRGYDGSPSVPVTVTTDKHKVEVNEFSDAVLSCTFRTEKDQNPRIEWKKKGKDVSFVYFDGHFKGPFEDRATIDGATVTLSRVTQEDAGEYRCEISAPLDTVNLGETNVTLKVLVPPHIPSCEIPSGAVTGSVVQLRCQDQQSIPPATYTWFKDNKPISQPRNANATYQINSHTGVLEFKAVAKEDTGRYSCLASNGVGRPQSCEGKHMTIEDVNVSAVVAAVVVVCLVVVVCGCGGYLLHRNGFFSPGHRGRSNVNYVPPPQEPQDFKHTQSFML